MNQLPDFPSFFHALWSHNHFPWQAMLADRVSRDPWPQALDLPTASGKTACIDVAVHALASQVERPLIGRTAPRRIWFVVDRRIVVDEAHDRARKIADKLAHAQDGALREIADRLRQIAGTDRPLAVARLRGGVLRDDGWARLPSQPAVITSTVDQLGSRLLFRGYGHSSLTAPIFAGLAANDSLIFLDEAHCSVPFLQTLRAVERYRGADWAETPLPSPFSFVVLSATPPADIPNEAIFPAAERDQALDHPVLRQRLQASKLAELVEVKTAHETGDDPLVVETVKRAKAYLKTGKPRVGVMVNRVRTAQEIARALQEQVGENTDVVLLTSRMRSFERDRLVDRWKPYLRANQPKVPQGPIVMVSTQCLEVGADFSFDALISEAASLDALRQRFGRLARMGVDEPASAAIIVREGDVKPELPDPIYGNAISTTWKWLCDSATKDEGKRVIDFGVEALGAKLHDVEDLSVYLAPTVNAPILLPAHLDLLCQTSPAPHPEPDVSLYLHGKHGPPEVRVVWRCDLSVADAGNWVETVALCPPASGEMLSVPLWRLRTWLERPDAPDDSTDIEGVGDEGEQTSLSIRPCLLWRGRDRSKVAKSADDIGPGDVAVLPAEYGIEGLGQSAIAEALGGERGLDLWEPVRKSSGRAPAVRLHRGVLAQWLDCPPLKGLVAQAKASTWHRNELQDAIDAVLAYKPEDEDGPHPPPAWWLDLLRTVRHGRIEDHPGGGIVFFGRETTETRRRGEPDLFADDDDLTSVSDREISLDDHSTLVTRAVGKLAQRCLAEELGAVVLLAASWHDVGKLDERFQTMLHHGDEIAAALAEAPLAKSAFVPASPARRRAIREASGLPESFRHELLSAQLAERHAPLPENRQDVDLVLHLIASHHGHARPFAPVSPDLAPPGISGRLGGSHIELRVQERGALPPPHRIDFGLADRFWRMTRRYGWWGLAYLEAIVRLGDWYGSAFVIDDASGEESER